MSYDVVFPLNFGLPATLRANRALAEAAITASRENNIPIFCAPPGIFDFADYERVLTADFAGYVSTVKQVDALVAFARERSWRRILVVAAPPHEWRAVRDVRAAGLVADINQLVRSHPRQIWYADASEHRQTRSPWRWWLTWELPARAVILIRREWYERRARR